MANKAFSKSKREKTELASALDKLAASIVKDVSNLDLEVKLLAMRTLTQYYSATTRAGDGDEQGIGFDTFREQLTASSSGGGSSGPSFPAGGSPAEFDPSSTDSKVVRFPRAVDGAAAAGETGEE